MHYPTVEIENQLALIERVGRNEMVGGRAGAISSLCR